MTTKKNTCVLANTCKRVGEEGYCNQICYPYVIAHGSSGKGGMWQATNVPKKYRHLRKKDLVILQAENKQALTIANTYLDRVTEFVNRGIGLYLFSIPCAENMTGTGTGKTTVATTIANEYTIERIKQHVTGVKPIEVRPALFIRVSEFQNVYNAQFRGTDTQKEEASHNYYSLKKQMQETELLVMDDISLRNATEAFTNELYEVIDERNNEGLSVIYTSNLPIEKLGDMLSNQIASRIAGMAEMVGFGGKDHRKVF